MPEVDASVPRDKRYTAVVMAANRRGSDDPLAKAGRVSHKCFIDIGGQPMLKRVVSAVLESERVGHLVIVIDADQMQAAKELVRTLGRPEPVTMVASRGSIGASVMAAIEVVPDIVPCIITTGDNALHTAEMVRYFCDELDECDGDAALGLTRAEVLLAAYPDGQRSFHRFRNGQFSGCNLYAMLTPAALKAPRTFNSGGQFAKKPWRFMLSFGPLTYLVYKSRWTTLEGFLRFLSRGLGISTKAVFMPFAEGPIDVDRVQDWELANQIVRAREGQAT